MPKTKAEAKTQRSFKKRYGTKRGTRLYWASVMKGTVHGRGIHKPRRRKRRTGRRKK